MENSNTPIQNDVESGKTTAIIAYITLIGLIIAFVMNNDKKNEFAKFHIRQMLGIFLTGVVIGFVNIIPILGQIVFLVGMLFVFVMWIIGFIAAINGKTTTAPVLGEKFQEWFSGL